MAAQMATRPAGGPDPSKFLWIGAIFVPLGIGLILVIAGGLLWVLVSIFGGEAKFGTLMGVSALSAIPSTILLSIVGTVVIHLQGTGQITSMQDLQPALGLDLLIPAHGSWAQCSRGSIRSAFGDWYSRRSACPRHTACRRAPATSSPRFRWRLGCVSRVCSERSAIVAVD